MSGRKICFFMSVVWLLIICTVLSEQIQEQMTVQVQILEPVFSIEEDQMEAYSREILSGGSLYEVTEGSEWEKGLKAEVVEDVFYLEEEGTLFLSSSLNGGAILYRTKELTPGCDVRKTRVYQGKDDTLLILSPDRSPRLLSVEGQEPFMENAKREALELSPESRVYSMNELERFSKNMPLLGILTALLLITLFTWISSWCLSGDRLKNKIPLSGDLFILTGSLYGICRIAKRINLPSSLLPESQIFDWMHYKNEFTQITEALEQIASAETAVWLKVFEQNLCYGIAAFAGILIIWCVLCLIIRKACSMAIILYGN